MKQSKRQCSRALSGVFVVCALCAGLVEASRAQTSGVRLETIVAGLSSPVLVTSAKDGSKRLFIVEPSVRIKLLQPGASAPSEFLDIRSKVVFGGERGLLGLTLHPQFKLNRRFFVNYTRVSNGATGVCNRSALSAVTATVGGVTAQVSFAGAQGQCEGLDQLNLPLPKSLRGSGDVDVTLTVDGLMANTVRIRIK